MSSILASLRTLSEEDQELLYQAPAIVTVLVAGADQHIDQREQALAQKLVNYRTFTADSILHDYYEEANSRFEGSLQELMAAWSPETGQRAMSQLLEEVGEVLLQLPEDHSEALKESLRSFAKKVAEADGGFLHMGGISAAERSVLDLKELDVE